MTNYKITIIAVLLVALACVGDLWRRADLQAAADRAALKATIQQQSEIIRQAKDDADKKKASIDQETKSAKTLPDQVALFAKYAGMKTTPKIVLPKAPDPSTVSIAGEIEELPNAPSVEIPASEFPNILKFSSDCKKSSIDLAACRTTTAALEKERDGAISAARGGSRWQRFKRGAQIAGISAGAGAIAAEVIRKILTK